MRQPKAGAEPLTWRHKAVEGIEPPSHGGVLFGFSMVARQHTNRWLPKSFAEIEDDYKIGDVVTATLPEWLAVEKEMVWLDLGKKRASAYDYLSRNPEELLTWFDKHMN